MTVDRAPFGSPTRALPLLLCGAALVGALSAPGSAATAAPPAFATLTGRLVVPRGTLDPRGVTLEVGAYLAEDTAAGEDSVPSSSPSPPRKPTVTLRPDGRFRLSSLAPGTARLTVRVPGYVEERVADIELVAGRTTKLRAPVLLRPGFDLEVTVEPPRDWEGRPWRVRASKRAEAAGPLPCDGGAVLAETEEAAGRHLLISQSPGVFDLAVYDGAGALYFTRDGLDLRAPADARLALSLPALRVTGEVTLGGAGVGGELDLHAVARDEAVHLKVEEDGRFGGTLPFAGSWRAHFQAANGLEHAVQVTVGAQGGAPRPLEIRLPATRLFGRILDADGEPMEGGRALVWGGGQFFELVANGDGDFAGEGLPAGRIGVRGAGLGPNGTVYHRAESGEELEIDIREGEPLGPLTLHLRPSRWVEGSLTAGGQPRGWVAIEARADDGSSDATETGEDGGFDLELGAEATRATIFVQGEGLPLQSFPVVLDGTPLHLQAGERRGELAITLPVAWDRLTSGELRLEIESRETPIPRDWIFAVSPSRVGDRQLAPIPAVPGLYRACLGPAGRFDRIEPAARKDGRTRCVEGELRTGETLRLVLPPL